MIGFYGRNHDAGCVDCADTGMVRDWYADTASGYRQCTREGCVAGEERREADELSTAKEAS